MKRLAGAVLAALVLFACCASPPKRVTTVTTLRQYRTVTLHAETGFTATQRVILERAARKVQAFTKGNAEIRVIYDLDFGSIGSIAAHEAMRHDTMWVTWSGSEACDIIDARHPRSRVLAETLQWKSGRQRVVFIADRIQPSHFESIAMHEFGHTVGFDDLDDTNAVMSGYENQRLAPHNEFLQADMKECQRIGLCQ